MDMREKGQLQLLYLEYCAELRKINGGYLPKDEEISDLYAFNLYMKNPDYDWHLIWEEERVVGFVIIGQGEAQSLCSADYEIAEAYVQPPFRRQGRVTTLLNEFVSKYKGTYMLLVLQNNWHAYRFWKHCFHSFGYVSCWLPRPLDLEEEILLLGFCRKKDKEV